MVPGNDQGWDLDGGEQVHVLDRLQVSIDDELAVRSPHLAVKVPRGYSLRHRIVIRVGMPAVKIGEITVAPGGIHVVHGVAVRSHGLPCPKRPCASNLSMFSRT